MRKQRLPEDSPVFLLKPAPRGRSVIRRDLRLACGFALLAGSLGGALLAPRDARAQSGAAADTSGAARHATSRPDSPSRAADSPFGAFENSKNRGPVNIQSDTLAMDYKNNAVMFTGKVHAVQGDGQLTSNTLNVKYGKDFHEVQEMVADGDVHISQGLRFCTAERGVMNQAAHTVVLTGSPVCHDANDQISGTKITVHTDTGRSEVTGTVKALIFPHEAKTRDNEPTGHGGNAPNQ